jgi:hypothetical protein
MGIWEYQQNKSYKRELPTGDSDSARLCQIAELVKKNAYYGFGGGESQPIESFISTYIQRFQNY